MPKKTTTKKTKTPKAEVVNAVTQDVQEPVDAVTNTAETPKKPMDTADFTKKPMTKEEIYKALNEDRNEVFGDSPTEVMDITLAKFKKLFKDEIKETADWLWREDKEGDFPDKATCKKAAISHVIDQHEEYHVTDRHQ